jgi:hypothetical protein
MRNWLRAEGIEALRGDAMAGAKEMYPHPGVLRKEAASDLF